MYTKAIVRNPCRAMIDGLRSVDLGMPNYEKAAQQHRAYTQALESCGLSVSVLTACEQFPDSTFVEDVALCTPFGSIVTRPSHSSRQAEIKLIEPILQKQCSPLMASIQPPATLEGGDILFVDKTVYIGLSKRTNLAGAQQLIALLVPYQYTCMTIPVTQCLHLKTGVSYLSKRDLLVSGAFIGHPAFQSFNQIIVEDSEAYAANCLYINGSVVMPKGFPKTKAQIEKLGYTTICIDVSEFEKIDGGLSCLSLRY